jgi:hypothetical protein
LIGFAQILMMMLLKYKNCVFYNNIKAHKSFNINDLQAFSIFRVSKTGYCISKYIDLYNSYTYRLFTYLRNLY